MFPRSSGILLHPISLPSRYGIGDLGSEAYKFIDFLQASGQSLWQILPLGPTGYGDSPYQCFSAFAGNPLLVSPDKLVEMKLLEESDLSDIPDFDQNRVNYGDVINFKTALLKKAYAKYKQVNDAYLEEAFNKFSAHHEYWLNDYALFRVLKDVHNGASWDNWAKEYALRDKYAIAQAFDQYGKEIEEQKFYQFLFFYQWDGIKNYCHEKQIQIIGDMPIFVAYDSADVWTEPHCFKLDPNGRPSVVAGVPPDYFSATGQRWGNPIYNWQQMETSHFAWWKKRIGSALEMVDIIRIDHFRGFAACWEIPAQEDTAVNGRWVEAPGKALFQSIRDHFGHLPIIAEDLGVITPDVDELRDYFEFPGMRILQLAFGGDSTNPHLPHNYVANSVVYTGTHDNDTAIGWYNSVAGKGSTRTKEEIEAEIKKGLRYLHSNGNDVHWDFIETAFASVSTIALIPLQDVLGLGTEARMNLPSSLGNSNWSWRFQEGQCTTELAEKLHDLSMLFNRNLPTYTHSDINI